MFHSIAQEHRNYRNEWRSFLFLFLSQFGFNWCWLRNWNKKYAIHLRLIGILSFATLLDNMNWGVMITSHCKCMQGKYVPRKVVFSNLCCGLMETGDRHICDPMTLCFQTYHVLNHELPSLSPVSISVQWWNFKDFGS